MHHGSAPPPISTQKNDLMKELLHILLTKKQSRVRFDVLILLQVMFSSELLEEAIRKSE